MDETWKAFLETQPRTIQDVYDSMSEEQKKVLFFMVGFAVEAERVRIIHLIMKEE
jgi:hypothetical protein